jgi:peroxiredoxin
MGILRKAFAWGALAVAVGIIFVFAMPSYRQGEASVAGNRAEDFPIELSGKPAHLADLKGKVVVLNFWATWCGSCVQEMTALNRLQQHIASRGGMVLGVSADGDPAAFEKFLVDQNVAFPTYRDPSAKDNISPIALRYGTRMIPETYIIDRHGRIARKIIGPQQWDSAEMLAYFDAILGQS